MRGGLKMTPHVNKVVTGRWRPQVASDKHHKRLIAIYLSLCMRIVQPSTSRPVLHTAEYSNTVLHSVVYCWMLLYTAAKPKLLHIATC